MQVWCVICLFPSMLSLPQNVFVCGGEKLAYHQAVVIQHSIFLTNLVKNFNSNEIIVTLDNVNPVILRILMDSIYSGRSDMVTGEVFYEVERLHQMLGFNIDFSADPSNVEERYQRLKEAVLGEYECQNSDHTPKQEIMEEYDTENKMDILLHIKDNLNLVQNSFSENDMPNEFKETTKSKIRKKHSNLNKKLVKIIMMEMK